MKGIIIHRIITISIACIILGSTALFIVYQAQKGRDLPYHSTLPEFEFVNQDSLPFSLNDLKGKITVVDFIFTRCKGPCPIMAVNMSDLYETFKDYNNIQFISISVDPDYDSLHILKQYAFDKGVTDDRWQFLHANMEKVVDLSENGFKLSGEDLPGAHSTKFVLVDELLNIRGYYSGIDKEAIEVLKNDIYYLVR